MYHFTNWGYGLAAAFRLDPARPTSLLYEKEPDGYRLIGAMCTARKKATETELDRRVPLSIARWHAHINICVAPRRLEAEMLVPRARFGPRGSIATEDDCSAAGGRCIPQLFGWMMHVFPSRRTQPRSVASNGRWQTNPDDSRMTPAAFGRRRLPRDRRPRKLKTGAAHVASFGVA